MQYFCQNGTKHQSFYAVNKENTKCLMIELRWKNKIGDALDGIILENYSLEQGNFDWISTTRLLTEANTITEQEFNKIKKQITSFINAAVQ